MKAVRFVLSLVVPLLALGIVQTVHAQDWPRQPVKMIVPYPPGGAADLMARRLSEKLQERWKQTVVVENKPGAGEIIATTSVIHSKADGYTILFSTEAQQTNPFLFSNLPYDVLKDLTPITRIAEGSFLYVVRRESPYQTIQQLVEAARAQPGKVSFGSGGAGGVSHVAVSWFAAKAGNIDFMHVPYKGASDRLLALMNGTVDFTAVPFSAVSGMLKDGRLRPLATTGAARMQSLPAVPTLVELNYKDAIVTTLFALYGPPKLPPEIADRIYRDVTAVMQDPTFKAEKVDGVGLVGIGDSPAEFAKFLVADWENQRARVKSANVKLD